MDVKESSSKAVTVYIYNSFNDPLFKNLMYEYILTLSKNNDYIFYLITFEQPAYQLPKQEQDQIKRELQQKNIRWFPKKFHTGKFLLLKKMYDLLSVFLLIAYLKVFKSSNIIWAFANVAAAQCIVFSKVLNLKLIIYSYEPHSAFMLEVGQWRKGSLNYKILKVLEEYAGKEAAVVLTGTRYMVEKLKREGTKAKVYRAPTSVDETKFRFSLHDRLNFRQQHCLEDRIVILYLGKFGGLYYQEEIIEFFDALYKINPDYFLLIVTKDDHGRIRRWITQRDIDTKSFMITSSDNYQDTVKYISTADIGLNAIPPTPSQKYRSPTKIAEYLLCGLPFVTCKGVSEDDVYAVKYRVGIAVDDFSRLEAEKANLKIHALLTEGELVLKERCRNVGLDYRAKSNIDKILTELFNREI
jgi:hypothetical protein